MVEKEEKQTTKEKDLKVLELRRAGLTWARIAEEVGYADHSGAHKAYQRAITNGAEQTPEELILQELDRLDRLQVAAWSKAMSGDVPAMGIILKFIEQRVKLLGLSANFSANDMPDIWDQLAAEIAK